MSDIAIRVTNLSKCYQIYDTPRDRLKQFVVPTLCRVFPPLRKFFSSSTLNPQSFTQHLVAQPLSCVGKTPAVSILAPVFYKEFWALKDVSFEIKKGETVGIIGRNGSGKSTLLQMICGTLTPTGGSIETNGRIAALLELGSGFNPEFTGRENVYMNAGVLGLTNQEIDARFDEIVAFADIGDFIEQPVKTYSSGMFVRLAFAIQANVEPEILIIDEALAVGDAYFVHRCMLRFDELKKMGTTILFVSHDAGSVRNLCSRAIWLDNGSIMQIGNSSEVVDAYLAKLFGLHAVEAAVESNTKHCRHNPSSNLQIETSIPNIDRRLGDQKCVVVGVALYDEAMNQISSSLGDKVVILRMTVRNISLKINAPLSFGYIFRSSKGQEIASTNSQIEGNEIKATTAGDYLTIQMKVKLPCLYPGSYAFTVVTGYQSGGGEIVVSDRVENAIVLNVLSDKQVHVMMCFATTFEVET